MARRSDSQDEAGIAEVTETEVAPPVQDEPSVPADVTEQIEDLNDLELIKSGKPVTFTITVEGQEREFAMRQLDPADLEMVRLQENIGYHLALEQPGMDELKKLGVSEDAQAERLLILAKYKADHEQATDPEKRRELSEIIDQWSRPDNRTRAQEIADKHSRRYRDRWMIDHLLCHPDGTALSADDMLLFKRAAYLELARPTCWKVIRLATSVPN